jgi:hypothetical protein
LQTPPGSHLSFARSKKCCRSSMMSAITGAHREIFDTLASTNSLHARPLAENPPPEPLRHRSSRHRLPQPPR